MKSTKRRVAAAILNVEQAVRRQFSIGRILREIRWTEQLAAQRIQRANEKKADRLRFLNDRLRNFLFPLVEFVRRERASLADPKTPSVIRLLGGRIVRTEANRIRVTDEKAALKALLALERKHPGIIRRTPEINKQYLHEHPELVAHIPGIEWDTTPADVFTFPDIEGRIECTDDDVVTITFPRRQQ